MADGVWRPSIGAWLDGSAAAFRVWAPAARQVAVRLVRAPDSDVALDPAPEGWFSGRVEGVAAGDRYHFVLDAGQLIPDPASRWQPDGVHGPSAIVDPSAFEWRSRSWSAPSIDALVLYELHVGTFTPQGTFAAAASRLEWLADLGVTAVELMPVSAFPGTRNWGYDGAALFAPADAYGAPDDLRRFVDRAHQLNLAVFADVVYNHFGPDGAWAAACSRQFFSDRHTSPWGAGINLDGPGSASVRRFFIEHALAWLHEYRFDGLRLDATHALVDDSPTHFLAELAQAVRAAVPGRHVLLVAEDHRNLRTLVDPIERGGWGLDGVWADDFHHVARRLAAGDNEGYYRDFEGTTGELARTLADGWLFQGERSVHLEGPRGTSPSGLPLVRFVICLQNHDQIGNRAFGERLHHQIAPEVFRALTAVLLLAPETPLLFMGQEWAASSPFLYFTDHHEELGRLVRQGRREEFRDFRAFADPALRERIPDPQDAGTFVRSRLDWDERLHPPHSQTVAMHRDLLALRRTVSPVEVSGMVDAGRIEAIDRDGVVLRRHTVDGGEVLLIARLRGAGRLVVSDPTGPDGWRVVIDTDAPAYASDGQSPLIDLTGTGSIAVDFRRPGAVVFRRGATT
jgi:maltooligosyltrehalose trehalohydrolase